MRRHWRGACYFAFILPQILDPDEMLFGSFLGASQTVLAGVILIFFTLASCTNPGIVPRNASIPKDLAPAIALALARRPQSGPEHSRPV